MERQGTGLAKIFEESKWVKCQEPNRVNLEKAKRKRL